MTTHGPGGSTGSTAGDTLVGVAAVEDYQQRMAAIARRAEAAREQMAAIRPSATSPDGAVTVSVTGVGVLADLSFGPAARTMELPALAQLVLKTAREAHQTAAVQTQQALAGLVGNASPALQFMRDFVPDDEDGGDGPAASAPAPAADPAEVQRPAARDVPPPRPVATDAPTDDDDGFTGRGL